MEELALLLEKVGSTNRTSQKVELVSEFLETRDLDELSLASQYLCGRPLPLGYPLSLNVGWSLVLETLSELKIIGSGWQSVYRQFGDLGQTVFHLLEGQPPPKNPGISLTELKTAFEEIARTSGKDSRVRKKEVLLKIFGRSSRLATKYLIRLILGDLRIGLRESLVENSIARAFSASLRSVREANLLLSDIGEVALMAKRGTLMSAILKPGRPFRFMLAESISESAELFRSGGKTYLAEDKYDGIRAQLHVSESDVLIYSRNLEEIGRHFPELKQASFFTHHQAILDGEIVAFREKILPFALLQQRLHRVSPDSIKGDIPVAFFAFDLLFLDSQELMHLPLRKRRELLETLSFPQPITLAHQVKASSPQEIESAFAASRMRGNEGLVIKDPESRYSPGKRGKQWLKYKKELTTLDCVVVAVEWGHGKRAGLLSDYTFAVRGKEGELLTIGKAFSGLSDEEIKELTAWFKKHALKDEGWRILVEPQVVVEVAFNQIQKSSRHKSGYALRFPRIKRIREDKSLNEINTIADVEKICIEGGKK